MRFDSREYAPYIQDGLLHLPSRTLDLLAKAGVKREVVQAAQRGLALDLHRRSVGEVSDALEALLMRLNTTQD